jgi:transcriptional regulator with XRE-family HTH domain
MDIGQTILRVRKEKGIKQKDLAKGAGISSTYLSQI